MEIVNADLCGGLKHVLIWEGDKRGLLKRLSIF
jgi:hypothetical protein